MKMSLVLLIGLMSGYSDTSRSTKDIEKLVETEKAFAQMARDTTVRRAFLEFLDVDGVVFEPGPVNGRTFWAARTESAALLAWNPVWADVSSNGKIGYTTGDWNYFANRKDAVPIAFGQYITIWRKRRHGNFKAVLDIGNSHDKPRVTENIWKSPKLSAPGSGGKISNFRPVIGLMEPGEYREILADDVRLYREGKLPFIGIKSALVEINNEHAKIKEGRIPQTNCGGESDLMYCYGVIELTKKSGTVEKGNLVRIWKSAGRNWRIVLEIYTPIPAKKD